MKKLIHRCAAGLASAFKFQRISCAENTIPEISAAAPIGEKAIMSPLDLRAPDAVFRTQTPCTRDLDNVSDTRGPVSNGISEDLSKADARLALDYINNTIFEYGLLNGGSKQPELPLGAGQSTSKDCANSSSENPLLPTPSTPETNASPRLSNNDGFTSVFEPTVEVADLEAAVLKAPKSPVD